jgi:hypothetical protein
LLLGFDEEQNLQIKGEYRLARLLDTAARIKQFEDELRRKHAKIAHELAYCIEVDGGIFEHLL